MANYTVNQLNQAAWLVYINGLEIPVSSMTIQFGVWQVPTATLNMVPHQLLSRIGAEDRLQVAIFYLDCCYASLADGTPGVKNTRYQRISVI